MANWLYYSLISLSAVIGMEFMAWFTHRFVMHGFLWQWHEDHHLPHHEKKGFWEKNDRFFLVYAFPSMLCYMYGAYAQVWEVFYIGVGISIYGMIYFLIHDVYIHRRFNWFPLLDNAYSRAILRAHGAHHAKRDKEDGESFGLLVVDTKFFRKRTHWTKKVSEEYKTE
jgi:beta-carotene 3-hydroxylase